MDLDTNKEETLYEREGSNCSFKHFFSYNNYSIQLRLDWDDLTNEDPTLDADIVDQKSGKLIKNGKWHHTKLEFLNSDRKIYTFMFQEIKLGLYIIRTMEKKFTIGTELSK